MDLLKAFSEFGKNFTVELIRYLVAAGTLFLLVWIIFRQRLLHRLIQQKFPERKRLYSEFLYSMSTLVIFGVIGIWMIFSKHSKIYIDVTDRGWPYFFVSIVLAILMHDTYFYWTHRLMHHPRLFRHIHLVHHQSTNPSPWAAYSFHPFEAIVQGMIGPILVFTLPLHTGALITFGIYQIVYNAFGHLSFELFPKGFTRSKWIFWHNTATHHNMHHRYFNKNFTIYFNVWDRIMGTLHKDYDAVFDEVTSRERVSKIQDVIADSPQA